MKMNKYFLFFSLPFPVSGIKEIAKQINFTYSGTQAFLRELVREGYVRREIDIDNLRKSVYTLTPLGKRMKSAVDRLEKIVKHKSI